MTGTPDSSPANPPSKAVAGGRLPAVLISTIVHTILLIVLALLTYKQPQRPQGSFTARLGEASEVVRLQASVTEKSQAEPSPDVQVEFPESSFASSETSSLRAPPLAPLAIETTDSGGLSSWSATIESLTGGARQRSPLVRLPGGGQSGPGALSGRTPEGRQRLGQKYGATVASERAVDDALQWLADHQRHDGSWSFDLHLDPCNGRCRHSSISGDNPTPSTAATGLALLAFLGAGHTHQSIGPYSENVRRGLYYLRGIAAETQSGYDWQKGSMYGHGIALMALGEALSMTSDGKPRESDLYPLVARGAEFTCVAQHSSGSWGYYPQSPGDMTVTGWQVLSLIAAKRNRVPLKTYVFQYAKEFVMSTSADGEYWFGYRGPPGEPTTTAIGLTLAIYLGDSPTYTPLREALSKMAQRGPTLDNIYHDYYATLALHHARHPDWDQWNAKLRDHLVATQEQSGHERGSWHFKDRWGDVGGRLYTTAMCALTLEVYYRYLPLYAEVEDFPF